MNNLLRHCRPLAAVALILFYAACVWAQSAEMAFVPAGEFEMGDSFDEGGSNELPVHTVYLSPYYVDKYEVTNQQYADGLNWAWAQGGLIHVSGGVVYKYGGTSYGYCDTTTSSSYSRITWNGSAFGVVAGKEDHPMVKVSWYGSVAYCNWRSAMEGKPLCYDLSTWTCNFGSGYRLPTEAEWEKAAGWDPAQQRHFRFGEHTDGCGYNCLEGQRANYWNSGDPFETGVYPWTTPVGYYDGSDHGGTYQTQDAQSYYGCRDMSGNVWEWCHDWYSNSYYASSPGSNPTGPASGTYRVLRGGGWLYYPGNCRVAYRGCYSPGIRNYILGFRCAVGTWGGCPDPPPENADGNQSDTSGSDGDPVNTATGNFFHQQTDLSASTRGGLMAFTRYYNSTATASLRLRRDRGIKGPSDQGGEDSSQLSAFGLQRSGTSSVGPLVRRRPPGLLVGTGESNLGSGIHAQNAEGSSNGGRQMARLGSTNTPRAVSTAPGQGQTHVKRRKIMKSKHGIGGSGLIALTLLGLGLGTPVETRADLNDGLVGYWSFDEGEGDVAYDSTGNARDGTIYGAAWTSGISGAALQFAGNDYVRLPRTSLGSAYSSSLWFVQLAADPWGLLVHRGFCGGCNYEPRLQVGGIGGMSLFASVSGCSSTGMTHSDVEVAGNEWHHLVYAVTSQTQRLYVDGIEMLPPGSEGPRAGNWYTLIGASAQEDDGVATKGFLENAIIDEVRIYNRALSEDEIRELYEYPGWVGGPVPQGEYRDGDQEDESGSDADPVNTSTGNFYRDEADLSAPTRGRVILCSRGYNSRAAEPGRQRDRAETPQGPGWTHSYYIWLEPDAPDGQVGVHYGDGHADYWMSDGEGGYVMSVPGVYDELIYNDGDGSWTLTQTNEDVYQFDADGRLLSITDKNDNITSFSYDNPNVPFYTTAVTDPIGRSLVLEYQEVATDIWRLWKVTDWTGRYVEYTYTDGYLTDVRDVMGEHITYTYDANGYLATVTDQRDVTTVTNVYDAEGRVLQQFDADGNETEFNYAVRGDSDTTFSRQVTVEGEAEPRDLTWFHPHEERYKRQLQHEDPLGTPVEYGYDGMFNRNKIVDRNGNETGFTYDERGNVTAAIEADDPNDPYDGGTTSVTYPDPESPEDPPCPHVPLSKTDALGYMTEWEYDDDCNVILERRYLDLEQTTFVEKSWTYNDFGQRTSETDERGHTHTWIYDANGLLIEEIDRESNHTWYGYDDLWRRIWTTDGRGSGPEDPAYTTYFFYDNADRLIRIEGPPTPDAPGGITRWFGYDEIGNRAWVTDGRGSGPEDPDHTTRYFHDNRSQLVRVEAPEGQTSWYVYDELGRKVRMYDANNDPDEPGSVYTWYVYDDGDRLTETHDPEGNVWTYQYDLQGNLTREEDGAGVWVEHEYDALNRRVLTRTAAGETHFAYDVLGRLFRQIDAEGNETEYYYDALGRLTCVVDAEGGWTEYFYDAAGNLVAIEDARDETVSIRDYDNNNRLIYAEDGNGNYYTYGYDAVGNQILVVDANDQQTDLVYDAENRLLQIDYPDSSWVTYEYDNNGNRVAITESAAPGSPSVYAYDNLNRLTSSTDRFGMTVGYSYDVVGNRTSLTYPADGVNPARTVTYGYDGANRLTTITDWASRQTVYTYECRSRLDTITYPNGVVEDRDYDSAGRLDTLVTTDSSLNILLSYDYNRDGVGNPTTVTEDGALEPTLEQLITEYEYDADNRLVESSQGTYQYDANGNLTSRTVGGVTTTFTYDAEDRLTSQTTGTSTVQHVYDGQSHRIARIDNGVETRYVLDRGRGMSHVLCETDATGTITAYYIHGPTLVARIGSDGSQRYYHTNDIGNVVALTDENETVTDRYGCTPFGLLRSQEGSTPNPFTYVGALGVMAEADGLYFMRARFYDPDTGRFLGKDPVKGDVADARTLHRYVYTLQSPTTAVDPSGAKTWKYEVYSVSVGLGILSAEHDYQVRLIDVSITPCKYYDFACTSIGVGWGTNFGLLYSGQKGTLEGPDDPMRFAGRSEQYYAFAALGIGVQATYIRPSFNVSAIMSNAAKAGFSGLNWGWGLGIGGGIGGMESYCEFQREGVMQPEEPSPGGGGHPYYLDRPVTAPMDYWMNRHMQALQNRWQ